MARKAKPASGRGSWVVRCRCEIYKDVYVENCTEQQARDDPFDFATEEEEVDQIDWKVLSVEREE